MGGRGSGKKPDTERRERARRLRSQGMTQARIAAEMGCTPQNVSRMLRPPRGRQREPVPCAGCGEPLGPAAVPRDASEGLCMPCLSRKPDATFAMRLQAHRLAAGLSVAALARRARVTGVTVAAWERGEHGPRPGTLRKLAAALGVEPSRLDPLRG
jgi:transcriptional regulator with XRE-family HTH domain